MRRRDGVGRGVRWDQLVRGRVGWSEIRVHGWGGIRVHGWGCDGMEW